MPTTPGHASRATLPRLLARAATAAVAVAGLAACTPGAPRRGEAAAPVAAASASPAARPATAPAPTPPSDRSSDAGARDLLPTPIGQIAPEVPPEPDRP